jgi:hypothetical protein
VTVRFASAYFPDEVGHEDQQKKRRSYPDSGGEVHVSSPPRIRSKAEAKRAALLSLN